MREITSSSRTTSENKKNNNKCTIKVHLEMEVDDREHRMEFEYSLVLIIMAVFQYHRCQFVWVLMDMIDSLNQINIHIPLFSVNRSRNTQEFHDSPELVEVVAGLSPCCW